MKKIFYLVIAVLLFTSCDLTEHPYNIGESTLIDAPDGAQLTVNAAYGAFWTYSYTQYYANYANFDSDYGNALGWLLGNYGGGVLDSYWSGGIYQIYYQIIARANYAIDTIPLMMATPEAERNQCLGEAYFIRAFMYFEIVRCWGKVPLRLTFHSNQDMERSSVKAVCEQIISDLTTADRLMNQYGMAEWGRANKVAAKLLLAKVYATIGSASLASKGVQMKTDVKGEKKTFTTKAVPGYESYDPNECYAEVKRLCDEVIARRDKEFGLQPNYQSIWGGANRKNKEFVWGIPGNQNAKTQLGVYYSAICYGGYGWAGISKYLYDLYEKGDNRGKYGVFHYSKQVISETAQWFRFPDDSAYATGPDGKPTVYNSNSDMPFVTKWYTGDVVSPTPDYGAVANKDQDLTLLRFCEAYLLRAEAFNELDQPSQALADLKVIRDRAEASDKSSLIDKVDIRSAILEERALEYAAEFNRRYDLLRWGLYLDVMNATQSIPTTNNNINKTRDQRGLLWAIPLIEINNNKLCGTENNPGY